MISEMTATITGSEIYWITRLSELKAFVGILSGVSLFCGLFGLVILIMVYRECHNEDEQYWKKWIKVVIAGTILAICTLFGSLFIPTTKEYCAIKVIPMVVNNDRVQEIPSKVMDLADAWIEELKSNKESK